jgi:hypothetical protein
LLNFDFAQFCIAATMMLQCGISMNSDLQIVQSSISSRAVLLLSRLNHDAGCRSTSFTGTKSGTPLIRCGQAPASRTG